MRTQGAVVKSSSCGCGVASGSTAAAVSTERVYGVVEVRRTAGDGWWKPRWAQGVRVRKSRLHGRREGRLPRTAA